MTLEERVSPKRSESSRPWWQRLIGKLAATRLISWVLRHHLHRLDRYVLRISSGRQTATTLLTGLPVIWLTTTGAKSGKLRTTPLAGIKDGDDYILIASYLGGFTNPAWYYNLKADPIAAVSVNGCQGKYSAQEITGEDWLRYWKIACESYAGFEKYRQRSGGRNIPVILLKPLGDDDEEEA
jgi:deazaflavin-dependent oxidoreductase (nitroreductase family)